jgi:hypothetical protein
MAVIFFITFLAYNNAAIRSIYKSKEWIVRLLFRHRRQRPVAARQAMISFGGNRLEIPVNHLGQAIVHKNRVMVAQQRFAPFLNPHVRLLRAINHKMVNFMDRFVENAGGLENRAVINADDQGAAKLVEIEFDEMFVHAANLQREFHKSWAGARFLQGAIPVPLAPGISLTKNCAFDLNRTAEDREMCPDGHMACTIFTL